MKIIINNSIGGFGFSKEALEMYFKKCTENRPYPEPIPKYYHGSGLPRNDKNLVEIVELLGERSWGENSVLKIVEIPDNILWYIVDDESGIESIHENHRIWD